MKFNVGIFALGLLLILGATLGALYYTNQGLSKAREIHLGAGQEENISYSLKAGVKYTVVITSSAPVRYTLVWENGTIIANGTVKDRKQLSITPHESEKCTVNLKALGNDADVGLLVDESKNVERSAQTWQTLLGTCIIGIALSIAGIIASMLMHKK